jgi:anti-anti-sigma factor
MGPEQSERKDLAKPIGITRKCDMAEITFRTIDHWTIARFESSTLTDSQVIERASIELTERIAKMPLRPMLLINFKSVEFVSSQVIALLLNANKKIAEKSGTLMLCRVSPKIRQALEITGLLGQFTMARSETEVVGPIARSSAGAGASDIGWLD